MRKMLACMVMVLFLALAGCVEIRSAREWSLRIVPLSGAVATEEPRPTLTATVTPTAAATITPTPTAVVSSELLVNGDFEGAFTERDMSVVVADGWEPLHVQGSGSPEWELRQPEWKAAAPYENRIHGGENAQQWFGFYATIDGGVYQVVDLAPGTTYRLSFWGQVWSSAYDDENTSEAPGQAGWCVRVGPNLDELTEYCWLLWEKDTPIPDGVDALYYDEWNLFEYKFAASSVSTVVYIGGRNSWPVKHNDFYLDDASLIAAGSGGAAVYNTPTQDAVEQVAPAVYLNLRDGPGNEYAVRRVLIPDEVCILAGVDDTGDWYNVECDGDEGWAWGEYLTVYIQ